MASGGFVRRHADAVALIALTVLGALLISPQLGPHVRPSPDILFYEAQKRELLGTDAQTAREEVFTSRFAVPLIADEQELSPDDRRVANPAWREYSAKIYRRRWVVPALAAGLDPVFGDQSLEIPALIGWLILGPLLYLFLRPRFAPTVSAAVSALCVILPPMFDFGPSAGTDVLALSLVVAALACLWKLRSGAVGWFAAWFGLAAVIAFTRDAGPALIGAAGWLAVAERSRIAAAAGLAAAAASVPPLVAFGAPLQSQLAYILNDFRIPEETSWGSILHDYPGGLADVVKSDLGYPLGRTAGPLMYALAAVITFALIRLYATSRDRDPLLDIARGAGLGGLLTILITVNDTNLRLELIFVPVIAVALAALAELAVEATRRSGRARAPI